MIAATHGKRAVDNLAQFKPHIKAHEMDDEVTAFEESILFFADAFNKFGPGSQPGSPAIDSGATTPSLTPSSSAPSSRAPSRASSFVGGIANLASIRRPSFLTRLSGLLTMSAVNEHEEATFDDPIMEEQHQEMLEQEGKLQKHQLRAWQLEATAVDRSVRILPGVKKMISSIPEGRYAVATSGAKTYGESLHDLLPQTVMLRMSPPAYGCMTRVGITPPKVTITADDKRLKAGKPAPDPFLLAAKELGFDAKKCVVFEDSPSGIRAGVASGATVIAVCTSHERSKIENCGAHHLVDNMDKVTCEPVEQDGQLMLKFSIFA